MDNVFDLFEIIFWVAIYDLVHDMRAVHGL